MWIKQDNKQKWCNLDYIAWTTPSDKVDEIMGKICDGRKIHNINNGYALMNIFSWKRQAEGAEYWRVIERNKTLNYDDYVFISTHDDAVDATKLIKFFGIKEGTKIFIKTTSNKYTEYKYLDGVFYGIYEREGIMREARLKTHTFLKSRGLDEKAIQLCLKELNVTKEFTYEYKELVEGYNDTQINSCMQGNGNYFESLSDCGKLLVAYEDDNQVGRAIVWNKDKLDGLPDIYKGFMDRIYPSDNHEIVRAFKKYAREHKLLTRMEQNYRSIMKFDNEENLRLVLNCGNLSGTSVPYMDTFKYYNEGKEYLHNDNYHSYDYKLNDTDGTTLTGHYCVHCDTNGHDETVYVEGYGYVCDDCINSNDFFHCDDCGDYFRSIRTESHNVYGGDIICNNCLENCDYVYSEYHEEYLRSCDSIHSELDDCYYHQNDILNYSDKSDTYSMNEDLVEVIVNRNGRTENWFECEAAEDAYYDEENDCYYKTHELYVYLNDSEIEGIEDDED